MLQPGIQERHSDTVLGKRPLPDAHPMKRQECRGVLHSLFVLDLPDHEVRVRDHLLPVSKHYSGIQGDSFGDFFGDEGTPVIHCPENGMKCPAIVWKCCPKERHLVG